MVFVTNWSDQVILFEGWMLGFKPLPNEVVKAVDPQVNPDYKLK